MISKSWFIKRIKFHAEYNRLKRLQNRKKPVTLEASGPLPEIDNKKFKK